MTDDAPTSGSGDEEGTKFPFSDRTLEELMHEAWEKRGKEALEDWEDALGELALQRLDGDIAGQARALQRLGRLSGILDKNDECEAFYQESLELYRSLNDEAANTEAIIDVLDELANCASRKDDRNLELDYHKAALVLEENIGVSSALGLRYSSIFTCCAHLGLEDEGQVALERAIMHFRLAGDADNLIMAAMRWGGYDGIPQEEHKQAAIESYLRCVHASLMYADCAGEEAYIPSLHYNRLVNIERFNEMISQRVLFNPTTNLAGSEVTKAWKHFFNEKKEVDEKDGLRRKKWLSYTRKMQKRLKPSRKFPSKLNMFKFQVPFEKTYQPITANSREHFLYNVNLRNWLLTQKMESELSHDKLCPSVDLLKEIESKKNTMHVIYGDPGYGKTIHMQQLGERFLQAQRVAEHPAIPIVVKATDLSHAIRHFGKEQMMTFGGDRKDDHYVQSYDDLETCDLILSHASGWLLAERTSNHMMPDALNFLFPHLRDNRVFFVDAFDEVNEEDMRNVVAFLSRITNEGNNCVVLSNRNSHAAIFDELWGTMPGRTNGNEKVVNYHIDFTPNELRYDMPEKLLAAWEISGDVVEAMIEKRFSDFENVLTHPLFVGFFSLMIKEKSLGEVGITTEGSLSLNGYTTNHLRFLTAVLEFTTEKAVSDRFHSLNLDAERALEIFEAFSYAKHATGSTEVRTLTPFVKEHNLLQPALTEEEEQALRKGIGPLHSPDEKKLEWVHKGLMELGAVNYLLNHPSFERLHPFPESEFSMLNLVMRHLNKEAFASELHGLFDLIRTTSDVMIATLLTVHFIEQHGLFSKVTVDKAGTIIAKPDVELDEEPRQHAVFLSEMLQMGRTELVKFEAFSKCLPDYLLLGAYPWPLHNALEVCDMCAGEPQLVHWLNHRVENAVEEKEWLAFFFWNDLWEEFLEITTLPPLQCFISLSNAGLEYLSVAKLPQEYLEPLLYKAKEAYASSLDGNGDSLVEQRRTQPREVRKWMTEDLLPVWAYFEAKRDDLDPWKGLVSLEEKEIWQTFANKRDGKHIRIDAIYDLDFLPKLTQRMMELNSSVNSEFEKPD